VFYLTPLSIIASCPDCRIRFGVRWQAERRMIVYKRSNSANL
jgi:hypothetical protein